MEAIVVKRATLKEVDCVSDLFEQYRSWRMIGGEAAPPREALEQAIEGQGCIVLVAVKPNRGNLEYVGFAELCPTMTEQGAADWGLGELFVRPESRHRGVEQALLAAVIKYTACKDARLVLSEACRRNATLKPLYDALAIAGNA